MLQKEFQLLITREMFWRDSQAVLGCIRNQSRKLIVFVANRVEIIQEGFCDSQWFHLNIKTHPADYWSRRIDVNNTKARETWFNGRSYENQNQSGLLRYHLMIHI